MSDELKTPEQYKAEAKAKLAEVMEQAKRDSWKFADMPDLTEDEAVQFVEDKINEMTAGMSPEKKSEILRSFANFMFWATTN